MTYLKSFLVLLSILLQIAHISTYSNNQAFKCFIQKGLPTCHSLLQQCTQNESCQAELQGFNHCSFDDSQAQGSNVFNGYCFRRWLDKSYYTKQIISCLVDTCDLLYNSEIGIGELYQCMQSLFLQRQPVCGEECQKQMEHKIGANFNSNPIKDLYREQQFENSEAQEVVRLVANECIAESGSVKNTMYQEELQKEQQRPKRKSKSNQDDL